MNTNTLTAGMQVANGLYRASVVRHYTGSMWEVRGAGGTACVDAGSLRRIVDKAEFSAWLRDSERAANAGATTRYDEIAGATVWIIGPQVWAVSGGKVGASTWYAIPM